MSQNNQELVYNLLKKDEPQTPNEVAAQTHLTQRTVQTILLDLATSNPNVKTKKIGRYRLFWRVK